MKKTVGACFGKAAAFTVLLLAATLPVHANPLRVAAKAPFADAPQELHDFLIAARAADRIADPLKRCLAYPDLPRSRWPDGLVTAYCHYLFDPRIDKTDIRDALRTGRLVALDARFKVDLDRHFSTDDFSEIIHRDFQQIDATAEWDALTKAWLERAPHSPYALAARGNYFRAMAWKTRGKKWTSETPKADMQRMSELVGQAVGYFQRALAIERRLLPAYVGLLDIGNLDSRPKLKSLAVSEGNAFDPGCKDLSRALMTSLLPRWGGSYPAMLELAGKLSTMASLRPLLVFDTIMPRRDIASRLFEQKRYEEAYGVIEPVTRLAPSPGALELAERIKDSMGHIDSWQRLAYLLEASRFQDGDNYIAYTRGWLMFNLANDPEWAIPSFRVAVREDPGDAWAHYELGFAYSYLQRYPQAEAELHQALKDKKASRLALRRLVEALISQGKAAEAMRYTDQLMESHPEDAMAWFFRGMTSITQGNYADAGKAMNIFVQRADPDDMDERANLEFARHWLERHPTRKAGSDAAR